MVSSRAAAARLRSTEKSQAVHALLANMRFIPGHRPALSNHRHGLGWAMAGHQIWFRIIDGSRDASYNERSFIFQGKHAQAKMYFSACAHSLTCPRISLCTRSIGAPSPAAEPRTVRRFCRSVLCRCARAGPATTSTPGFARSNSFLQRRASPGTSVGHRLKRAAD